MKSHLALIDDYNTYYTRKKLIEVEMEDDPRYIKQTFIKHYRKDTNKYIVGEAGRTKTGVPSTLISKLSE